MTIKPPPTESGFYWAYDLQCDKWVIGHLDIDADHKPKFVIFAMDCVVGQMKLWPQELLDGEWFAGDDNPYSEFEPIAWQPMVPPAEPTH